MAQAVLGCDTDGFLTEHKALHGNEHGNDPAFLQRLPPGGLQSALRLPPAGTEAPRGAARGAAGSGTSTEPTPHGTTGALRGHARGTSAPGVLQASPRQSPAPARRQWGMK